MSRRNALLPLALCLALPARADLSVVVTSPVLNPGMESLQTMLSDEIADFSVNIEALLETALAKPLFMGAFTVAAGIADIAADAPAVPGAWSVSLGSAVSAWAASWSGDTFEVLSALRPEDDIAAGACVEPLVLRVSVPLSRIFPGRLRGFELGLGLGFMDSGGPDSDYSVRSFSGGIVAAYRLVEGRGGSFRWNGISLGAGTGYTGTTLGVTLAPGPMYRTVPIDPDGAGPLAPIMATLSIDPSVNAGVTTGAFGARLRADTGFSLWKAFTIAAGTGIGLSYGSSRITIDADEPVRVEGYLATLVAPGGDGRVVVTGSTNGVSALSLGAFLSIALGFEVGSFRISLPVVWEAPAVWGEGFSWNFPGGFGAGAFLGVVF